MCLGRFHIPLRNSKFKILLSIYGSELVSEQARKHQNCLSFSGSSTVTLTFPGRKSQLQQLEVESLFTTVFIAQ